MQEVNLVKGAKYDISTLRLAGWTVGNGSSHEGYNWLDFFGDDGTYKGADQDGIEPVLEIEFNDDFIVKET